MSNEMVYKDDYNTLYYPYLQLDYFTYNHKDVHKEILRVFEIYSLIFSNNKTTRKNEIYKLIGCGNDRSTLAKKIDFL